MEEGPVREALQWKILSSEGNAETPSEGCITGGMERGGEDEGRSVATPVYCMSLY